MVKGFVAFNWVLLALAVVFIVAVITGCASPSTNEDWLYKTIQVK